MSVIGLIIPVSLLAVIAETTEMLSTESKISVNISKFICPKRSVGTIMPPLSLTGSRTAGCSVAVQTGVPPSDRKIPSIARLSASVPPLVNTTSEESAPTSAATASLASSTARRASRA